MEAIADDDLVAIPPGRVMLSDRRTRSTWSVDVEPYLLGAFPVTRSIYALAGNGRTGGAGDDRMPVTEVSWWDAVHFCNTLSMCAGLTPAYRVDVDASDVEWDTAADGYRLPTEAEWEYACRAGTSGPHYGELDEIAWYRGNSGERIHAVGGKKPNAWGLYDMLGNAWSWCWDLYDAEVYGSYRVLRGGGWFDESWSCRASVRRRSHPSLQIDDVGLRLARSVPL